MADRLKCSPTNRAPPRRGHRGGAARGRRSRRPSSTADRGEPARLQRPVRVLAAAVAVGGAVAPALQLQQPAGCMPGLQRIRAAPRVRRAADPARPGSHARRRRRQAVGERLVAAESRGLSRFCARKKIPLDVPSRKLTPRRRSSCSRPATKRLHGCHAVAGAHAREPVPRVASFLHAALSRSGGVSRVRGLPPARGGARGPARAVSDIGSSPRCPAAGTARLPRATRTGRPPAGAAAGDVLEELRARVGFLEGSGSGYLSLDRASRTLSGGEMQRIHLANALGRAAGRNPLRPGRTRASACIPRDTARSAREPARARRSGQHGGRRGARSPRSSRAADYLIDLGPGAGEHGGRAALRGQPPMGDGRRRPQNRSPCAYLRGDARDPRARNRAGRRDAVD